MRTRVLLSAACLMVGLLAQNAQAGKFNKVLNVGDAAPSWEKLVGVDNAPHSSADLKDAKAIVVAFTCNHCPVAQAYEERFAKFAEAYKGQKVAFVAISVSNLETDKLDKMKERAEQQGFPFVYLHDPSQNIGKAFGAAATPHLFVLDGDHKVAYMGAFDANINRRDGDKRYVEDAVTAVLAGKQPEVTETRPSGCPIQYED